MVNNGQILLAAMLGVTACSKPEPPQTVGWYLEHPDVMRTKVAWCSDDAARRQLDDCQNALTANGRKQQGRMKDMPPIDWNAPDRKTP